MEAIFLFFNHFLLAFIFSANSHNSHLKKVQLKLLPRYDLKFDQCVESFNVWVKRLIKYWAV